MHPVLPLALLEVMDKEPGIKGFWASALDLGMVGYTWPAGAGGGRFRR